MCHQGLCPEDRYLQLLDELARAGEDAPLAWLSMESPRHERGYAGTALELTVWPAGETRRLAQLDHHAASLEWA